MAAATYRRQSTYKVTPNAKKEFHCLYLTEETVRESLSDSGFNIECFEVVTRDQVQFNPGGCYCYVARKQFSAQTSVTVQ